MGNVGRYQVITTIDAWLVGLHAKIAPMLPKALQWLDHAIVHGEDFGTDANGHRGRLCWAKALGGWMLDGGTHEADWQALISTEASWQTDGGPWSTATILK